MRGVPLALGLTLGAVAVVVLILLSQDGRRLAGSNNVFERFTNVKLAAGQTVCERHEFIPAGTAWVRLSVDPGRRPGSALRLALRDRSGAVVRRGALAAGWRGAHVDVPVAQVGETLPGARVCVTAGGKLGLRGHGTTSTATGALIEGEASKEQIRVAYLRAGEESWWSLIPAIAHRMGVARGEVFDGRWMFVAWAALLAALVGVAAAAVAARRTLRRVPLAGWLCALAALLSGTAWALVTPAWHVPDEVAHFAYAQHFAETGELPRENGSSAYAAEEQQALEATQFYLVVGDTNARPPWTDAQDRAIDAAPRARSVGTGTAQSATSNPPLYYALQAVPYRLGKGLDVLDRLMLMRLLSVLCAAVTALATFLFVRELLPGTPWAWTAGGLAAAVQPLFGFVSAGVQGDALLYTTSALLLLAIARAFRRGLTPATGAAIGGVVALGVLGKLTFLGLVPGAALAVLILLRRSGGTARRGAATALGLTAGAALAYAAANRLIWDRPLLYGGTGAAAPADGGPVPSLNLKEGIGYLWQLYLPRLPFQNDQFGDDPMPDLWIHGLVGRFGWLDAFWTDPVYTWGGRALMLIGVLAVVALVRAGAAGALRGRWGEIASYAAVVIGLLALVGWAGYRARVDGAPGFEQARYLLPLLPFYATAVALAARLWGKRGPVVGAVLVGLAVGHAVLAQLLVVSRFYG